MNLAPEGLQQNSNKCWHIRPFSLQSFIKRCSFCSKSAGHWRHGCNPHFGYFILHHLGVNRLAPLLQCWIQLKNQRLYRNFCIVNFIQKSYSNLRGKVIQTNKSPKIYYPEVLSKIFLSIIYVTYSMSLYTQKAITQKFTIAWLLMFKCLFYLTL